jgi:hypothetical protein
MTAGHADLAGLRPLLVQVGARLVRAEFDLSDD